MKISEFMNIPIEKIKAALDSFEKVTAGRQLSDQEQVELQAEIKAYNSALLKCSKGHLVSPEFKPLVDRYEKADFNLKALPADIQSSFAKTYEDLSEVIKEDPAQYKNSAAEAYCGIYEMLSNNVFEKVIKRAKKSSLLKGNKFSSEMMRGTENFEQFLSEQNEKSLEFASIGGIMTGINVGVANTAATISNVNSMLHILSILWIFLIAALIVLIIVSCCYNINLAKNLEILTDKYVEEKGIQKAKKDRIKVAAKETENKIPNLTKIFLFKPVMVIKSFVEKMTGTGYAVFDKSLTRLEKLNTAKSKEEWEEIDAQSQEALPAFLVGVIAPVTGFLASPAGIALCVALSLPLLLSSCRMLIYWISRFQMKVSTFFKDQAEATTIHIEELIAKKNDPTTSKVEKERLEKIIDKQKTWAKNLASLGDKIYKSQTQAGNDARDSLREDDNKDFEQQVRNERKANKTIVMNDTDAIPDDYGKTPDPINKTQAPSSGNKPIALF